MTIGRLGGWLAMDIGRTIASYRLRQRQIHNGRPWTQEDLAVAVGMDKAQINRIERERRKPTRETLIRICRALEMPWDVEQGLLMTVGHAPDLRFATEEELVAIIARAAQLVDYLAYPAFLFDVIGRHWHCNPFGLRFYASALGMDAKVLWPLWRGKSGLELYFNDSIGGHFQRLFSEEHMVRLMARRRGLAGLWQRTPEGHSQVARLRERPGFAEMWAQSAGLDDSLAYTDRAETTLHHVLFGTLRITIWWTRVHKDHRFLISHHLPVDESTRLAFALTP